MSAFSYNFGAAAGIALVGAGVDQCLGQGAALISVGGLVLLFTLIGARLAGGR